MKLHIKKRLAQALKKMNVDGKDSSDDDSGDNESEQIKGQNLFTKFQDPIKFWKHQLSIKENEIKYLKESLYPEEDAALIMKGFLNGLYNIHELNYIHRDIKPENIQMAPSGISYDQLKIIDFGFSAKMRMGIKNSHEEKIGTALYMAPE